MVVSGLLAWVVFLFMATIAIFCFVQLWKERGKIKCQEKYSKLAVLKYSLGLVAVLFLMLTGVKF
jgi:hypothetical protein